MPIVISVLNQKGGAGKTTIATNLAHAFLLDRSKVLLVDSDPQGSARDWSELNGGNLLPVVGLDRETLHKDLISIGAPYDIVIIDGAPQITKLASSAIKAADIVLIPVQPSPYDIWACANLVELITGRQEITDGSPLAYFVISRAIKNTKLAGEIGDALKEYGLPVLDAITYSRVTYPTTAAKGQTALHLYESEAAREVMSLRESVKEIINTLNKQAKHVA